MEQLSNGGMLYHEVQESKLCAVHCVNTVLQGPFFSEFDLAALASDLDLSERQVLTQGGVHVAGEESHNVSLDGDFSIQVLQKAMEVWDLQIIPVKSPEAEPAQIEPENENAFICHLQDHWFCIRKVNNEWYNFNSLYPAPEHLSKFYLSAYLATLKSSGWSIFVVRGNFPRECPIASSEGSIGYGQWLLPEDAERITKSSDSLQRQQQQSQRNDRREQIIDRFSTYEDEDEDLNAAIAASLMDSSSVKASAEASTPSADVDVDKNSVAESSATAAVDEAGAQKGEKNTKDELNE